MIEAYSPAQVYAAEQAVMARLPEGELMARAVAGLVAVVHARLADRRARRVVALIGPGNNGADALYAAATLAADGISCAAVHLTEVHDGAYAAAVDAGVVLVAGTDGAASSVVAEADIVLDGILGIGGRPGLPDFAKPWVAAIPDGAYVISVDLASGQDPSGMRLDPDGVFADETVTFSVAKPVHLLPPTEVACGLLTVVDIGLDDDLGEAPAVVRLERTDAGLLWPVPGLADDKYSRGVLGVIAGSEQYPGAAVLATTAAAEAGVGMIRYVGPPTPAALVRAAVPEAVHGVGRVQAWVIGPGLDTSAETGSSTQLDCARAVLAEDLPVLIDAGGLDLLAGPRPGPTLLTPHAGECARLLTRLRADGAAVERTEVEAAPVRHARELAALTGATVLLKGSTTVVVGPDEDAPVWSQADAPAWLATAGAGDVLAGLAGTLMAAGLPIAEAGALAALVHGLAADRANPGGPVRALGVAHAIPAVVAELLAT